MNKDIQQKMSNRMRGVQSERLHGGDGGYDEHEALGIYYI
jgi:hypothetical protein